MSKTLVLFVFHIYNNRVKQFINNALFEKDDTDFVIICNSRTIEFECPPYVKKHIRDNIGYDFGGWSDAILENDLYDNYDNFIFVNSSVIGPFLKEGFSGKWTDVYINGLQNCRLFGSTINTIKYPMLNAHIQSYIFAMNKETLQFLINSKNSLNLS